MSESAEDKILQAATRVFQRRGVRAATMQEIAETARIGRATLYRYFPGKDEVLAALVLSEAEELFRRLDELGGKHPNPAQLLSAAIEEVLSFLAGHRLLQKIFRREPELVLPYLTIHSRGLLTTAIRFIEPHMIKAVKGQGLDVDPQVASEWAVRIILSLLTTPSVVADLQAPGALQRYLMPVVRGFVEKPRAGRISA